MLIKVGIWSRGGFRGLPQCQLLKMGPKCPFLCASATWESSLLFLFPRHESSHGVRSKYQRLKMLAAVVDNGAACLPLPHLLSCFLLKCFFSQVMYFVGKMADCKDLHSFSLCPGGCILPEDRLVLNATRSQDRKMLSAPKSS